MIADFLRDIRYENKQLDLQDYWIFSGTGRLSSAHLLYVTHHHQYLSAQNILCKTHGNAIRYQWPFLRWIHL